MKAVNFYRRTWAAASALILLLAAGQVTADDLGTNAQTAPASVLAAPPAPPTTPAPAPASAPPLAYGVPQILKLVRAQIPDTTVIAYIKSSGNSYGLNADQIIYLREQGVSDAVVNAMLTQPRPGVVAAASAPAPAPVAAPDNSQTPDPALAEAQPVDAPASSVSVYEMPDSGPYPYPAYYPSYYGYGYPVYAPVGISIGFGGRFGGGGFHGGGYNGGFHGGGGNGGYGSHGGWHH